MYEDFFSSSFVIGNTIVYHLWVMRLIRSCMYVYAGETSGANAPAWLITQLEEGHCGWDRIEWGWWPQGHLTVALVKIGLLDQRQCETRINSPVPRCVMVVGINEASRVE